MAFPSQNQMIEDIQSEFILDITFMVRTIAGAWNVAKTLRATTDNEIASCLLIAQADDLLQNIEAAEIKHVYIVDPQLFAQLSLIQNEPMRLDQNFGGFPVFATWRNEDELKEYLTTLVHDRQETIWQDAIKDARQRFHFTDHTGDRSVPFFGRVAPWATETMSDIQRETGGAE